jgi:hypothetical protein
MGFLLKKSITWSDKGQRSLTVSSQTGNSNRTQTQTQAPRDETQSSQRSGTQTTVQNAKSDTQTNQAAVALEIEFEIVFRAGSPVTPEGETEPNPTC